MQHRLGEQIKKMRKGENIKRARASEGKKHPSVLRFNQNASGMNHLI